MNPLLNIERLSVCIPQYEGVFHPVSDISFSVGQGETFGIVGESGCGKSMSMLAIMQLLPKQAQLSAERIEFQNRSILNANAGEMSKIRGNSISMIFQDPMTSLNPSYTIGNQLVETYRRHRSSATRGAAVERALDLLERVGIPSAAGRLKQYPHQLSGGLRQRVMIAMALMCSPKILLADEPTTALDVTIQAQILKLLRSIQVELKIGIIFITHDLSVIARIAHRVMVMYAGQLMEIGPTQDVYRNPLHPYTKALLNCIPQKGKADTGRRLGAIPGTVPDLMRYRTGCPFRPRCSQAIDRCEHAIDIIHTNDNRVVRCCLYSSNSNAGHMNQ